MSGNRSDAVADYLFVAADFIFAAAKIITTEYHELYLYGTNMDAYNDRQE